MQIPEWLKGLIPRRKSVVLSEPNDELFTVVRKPLKFPVTISQTCPSCKQGEMVRTSNVRYAEYYKEQNNSDWYEHECTNCKHTLWYDNSYPKNTELTEEEFGAIQVASGKN